MSKRLKLIGRENIESFKHPVPCRWTRNEGDGRPGVYLVEGRTGTRYLICQECAAEEGLVAKAAIAKVEAPR